ncbi:MAG: aldehyde dehydrogenase family protein [Proteobacteria bacterium]|nr:aldehyde dehydrogenase family protein [Pseudomonadota bacterium]
MTINGVAVNGEATGFPVINPATEQEIVLCPAASEKQVDSAVQAAHQAFKEWRKSTIEHRRELLHQCAEQIKENRDSLAKLLSQEQGKPLARAEEEIDDSIELLQHVAKISIPNVILQDDNDARVEVLHKPLGVVAAIIPWNYPVYIAVNNLAMTLLAGNTIVIKPSPYTPLSTLLMADLLRKIIPAGAFNVVSGGDQVGAYLTKHPRIDKINFTGSVEVGKKIAQIAAKNLKPVTLELGGNDPAIVLPDADVKKIAEPLFWGAFTNTGQICIAIKRLYVHESVLEPLVAELKRIAESIKLGEGTDPGVQMGPLNNAAQLKKVKSLVADAKRKGAKIITGGKSLRRPGYFYPPTIITGVQEGFRIVDEEQFGPVLPIISYSDVEKVVALANNSKWGLGASVWTSDWRKGTALAQRLESGTAWVNQVFSTHPHAPFGGVKESGVGREGGIWGFAGQSELQTLSVAKK